MTSRRQKFPEPPRRRPETEETPGDSVVRESAQVPDLVAWRETLAGRLRLLPRQSGVYIFRDARGRVIYVGKAKRLDARVRSYFRAPKPEDPRLLTLRHRIRSLDYVVTADEAEALILETHFIKQYAPQFNIRLKDDKKYPYVVVGTGHRFPALFVTREVRADGSRYFGPFTQVKDLRRCLRTLRAVFQLRNCGDRRLARGGRECLQYFIGACTAPCVARVTAEEYGRQVAPLLAYLSGRGEMATELLEARMRDAARDLRFEESARLRDGVRVLESLAREQRMTPAVSGTSEVVGLAHRGNRACAVLLAVAEGKVVGKRHHLLAGVAGSSEAEVLRSLLLALYLNATWVPNEVICPALPEGWEEVQSLLSARSGHPVALRGGLRGPFRELLLAARENANLALEEETLLADQRTRRINRSVFELQEALKLERPPYRIEGYDISNFQGAHPVASIVVFRDGKPLKAEYRRLSMAAVPGPDDFAMIAEALRRRFERIARGEFPPPDLVLVDGGAGQVRSACGVLEMMGFAHQPMVGLAKREEEIVLPPGGQPLRLPRSSDALKLLQRVRDEAHRFAVAYHRRLRLKSQRSSELDQIRGVGPARRRALLKRFGSVDGLRRAEVREIAELPGFGPTLARAVLDSLAAPENRQTADG